MNLRGLRQPYLWGRDHPRAVDIGVAVLVTVLGIWTDLGLDLDGFGIYRSSDHWSVLLSLLATVPLVVWRRYPLVAFAAAWVASAFHTHMLYTGSGPWIAGLLTLYAVAAYSSDRRWGVFALVVTFVPATWWMLADAPFETSHVEVVLSLLVMLMAWGLGDGSRIRRAYLSAVEERADYLEREQDAQAQRAVVEERARIARELHDIVAHHVSVMVIQAGGARRTLERTPDELEVAVGAIEQVERTGRSALEEMQRLVGVLREDGDSVADLPAQAEPLSAVAVGSADGPSGAPSEGAEGVGVRAANSHEVQPQPGIADLPALLKQSREAGVDVSMQVEGTERPLPSGIELVVYRVAQEALTNVRKHAGPLARANVTLTYARRALTLQVVDDGRGASTWSEDPEGSTSVSGRHGLEGMVERVSLYSGDIRWGPRRGGGFQVTVRLPLLHATSF